MSASVVAVGAAALAALTTVTVAGSRWGVPPLRRWVDTRTVRVPTAYVASAATFGLLLALVLGSLRSAGVTIPHVWLVAVATLAWSAVVVATGVRLEQARLVATVTRHTRRLAESERNFRVLAECSGDVVVRHDADGSIAWVSPMVTDILGWRPEELLGRTIADLVHPEDASHVRDGERGLRTGDRMIVLDVRMATASGDWLWVQASMTLTGRGTSAVGVSVWRDVEDQVRDREALQQAQTDLRIAEQRLRSSLDVVPIGFTRFHAVRDDAGEVTDYRLEDANQHARTQTTPPEHAGEARLEDYFPQARTTLLWHVLEAALTRGGVHTLRFQRPDSASGADCVWDVVVASPDSDTVVIAWQDVTVQVEREQLLAAAYEDTAEARVLLHLALEAVAEPFSVWDVAGEGPAQTRLVLSNPAAALPHGLTPEEIVGKSLADLYDAPTAGGFHQLLRGTVEAGSVVHGPDFTDPDADQEPPTVWRPVLSPMSEGRVALVLHDVTTEVLAAERLKSERDDAARTARLDPLTGLLNRRGLVEALDLALSGASGAQAGPAVVFIDLDGFKQVNDTHGHEVGDLLLLEVAARLRALVRHQDVVARLGGDEFVLVLSDLPQHWEPQQFLDRARLELTRPVQIGAHPVAPAASIGIVRAQPGQTPGDLLHQADTLMYAEKRRAGRGL